MNEGGFAALPEPPYRAVIFSSRRNGRDDAGYGGAAGRRVEPARRQPGFLGVESARGDDGFGIAESYRDSEDAVRPRRRHAEHARARQRGRRDWYARFEVRVAKVERACGRGGD